jgi:hypothetical protein
MIFEAVHMYGHRLGYLTILQLGIFEVVSILLVSFTQFTGDCGLTSRYGRAKKPSTPSHQSGSSFLWGARSFAVFAPNDLVYRKVTSLAKPSKVSADADSLRSCDSPSSKATT